ncbi:hypothetical protein Tco_0545653 [Tanacetum coccineum]
MLHECYSSLVGYNTNGAILTNLSVYGPECLSGFQMLAYMLSPSGLICCGSGSDGESGLDLLRDEGGKSDESSGYRSDDGIDQAGSGVADGVYLLSGSRMSDQYVDHSGISLGQLCFLADHSGWWIEMEEEEAVEMIQKRQKI